MKVSIIIAALAVSATAAFADDKAVNWTGVYVGGHAGILVDSGATYTYDVAGNFEPANRPRPNDFDSDFVGGGQIGYLHQMGHLVVGVEASATLVDGDSLLLENPLPLGNDYRTTTDAGNIYAITGRVGVALDRFLPYVKVGYAWTEADFDASFISGAARTSISNTFDFDGIAYGAGLEYMLTDRLSIGIEYMKYDFDSQSATLKVTNSGITTEKLTADYDVDTVSARLNYKF